MQAVDFEVERQQADEELARLLGELVVEPLDSQLGERIQSGLFCFGEELDAKLKRQLTPLGKTRDLERSFEDLGENLEAVERRLQQQLAAVSEQLQSGFGEQLKQQELALREQLAEIEQAEVGRITKLQAIVEALAEQLTEARQSLGTDNRQLQSDFSEQLKQHGFALREQLAGIEQAESGLAVSLQACMEALAGQLAEAQQSLGADNRQLQSDLGEQLKQQGLALREQLAGKQEQGSRVLIAELKQHASAQQEQLQRSHAELSALLGAIQHLPGVLADLQGQATGDRQQVLEVLQQQQALLEMQQREIQQLRRSLSGFAWTGLVLGGLGCAGLTMLALHTPAIRTLLGLAA